MKINPKSEKGAITLIVLVAMLFLTAFLMSMYIRIANKAQTSAETTEEIAKKYNNIGEAEDIYNSYFADSDVIPIYTRTQLEKIGSGEQVTINGKIYTFLPNAYYTLQNDLDLGGHYDETTGTWTVATGDEWTPLSDAFTGILDGLGHTITGLYINDSTSTNQGLFGTLKGTVKNLSIAQSYIKAKSYVGSIAGKNEGTIENCYNTASIIGETNVTGGYFKSITTGSQIEVWSDNVLNENAYFVSGAYTATAPKGFKVSKNIFEQTIEDGMVIQDTNGNEFVWIPVIEDLEASYSRGSSGITEPKELTDQWFDSNNSLKNKPKYDSQEILDELYGTNYYTYAEDFKYAEEYAEMVEKVNANNGFYIGRYETTIDDDGSIGSKYNTTVLTAGTTYTNNSTTYYYRWYGLYYVSKNANVTGNGNSVQTAMIYGALYERAMDFIRTQKAAGKTTYDVDTVTDAWHTGSSVVKSGLANPGATGDVALNIWDLESNAFEWTQESFGSDGRCVRGGCYNCYTYASWGIGLETTVLLVDTSRLALYIK